MTDTATSGPALERSVLERKERDELATIALALGVKPAPRAAKAKIIEQILKEAGIDGSATEAAPKRGRPRKVPADLGVGVAASDSAHTETAVRSDDDETGVRSFPTPGSGRRSGVTRPSNGSAMLFDPFAEAAAAAVAPPEHDDSGNDDDAAHAVPGDREGGREESRGRIDGARPEGGRPGGGRPERDRNDRDRPERDRTEGGRSEGGRPDGARQEGGRPEGARPDGRPGQGSNRDRQDRGDRPQGPRSFQDKANAGTFDGEDGKGRRRRRRGRERERISPERDAQADRLSETYQGELIDIEGLLDIADQGYGYIRAAGYLPSPRDVYVPVNKVRQLGLRKGDKIAGAHRPPTPQEKFPAIVRIDTVNGVDPDVARLRPKFEELTPLFPDERLRLEMPGDQGNMVARIVELVSPIGKGQRGLIVSPPKAGKTTIMKQIAHSIEANNPEVYLMVLLVDERPEEVTDMRRSVKGDVIASTFDRPADEHTLVAELAIERAKRMVEEGKDVVIILDGITRLARAYNLAAPATGRIMSGGIDTGALYPPKKFFGAARNVEEGGSLTILATALVETGSTMDTVIFEEFKGTGNMELRLDRRLAEKRIYPAINVNESSTRREDLLYDKRSLEAIWKLRRVLNGLAEGGSAAAGLELLMDRIKTTRSNAEFLAEILKAPSVGG